MCDLAHCHGEGTNFSHVQIFCNYSLTSVFGSPPPRLTALANAGPYLAQPSHEPHCFQFLQLKDGLRAVRPQRSPFCPWTPCATWRQNSIPISCPQQLQCLGTRLSEFRAELDRVTLLQTPLHFRSWQDTKTTTHFANVPTATKARTELSKVKLYTWVPPPSTATATILSWLYCAAQKNHSHYFWDRPCMSLVGQSLCSVNHSARGMLAVTYVTSL
jgi:hypothetical protein